MTTSLVYADRLCQTHRRHSIRRKTRGASTFDYIIWSLLFILFIASVGALYATGITRTSQADAMSQYTQLYGTVRSIWGSDPAGYGTGDLVPTIISINAAPPKMAVGGTALINAFGGTVDVQGANDTATITFNGVSREGCVRVAALPTTGGTQGGATAIAINGAAQTIPISVAAAQTACNQEIGRAHVELQSRREL